MMICKVIGPVKVDDEILNFPKQKMCLVRIIDKYGIGNNLATGPRHDEHIIAFDHLGCDKKDEVLVVQGSVVRSFFGDDSDIFDALVVAKIEGRPPPKE